MDFNFKKKKTPLKKAQDMALEQARILGGYVKDGRLPSCYETIQDALGDMYFHLPWDGSTEDSYEFLCTNPECQKIAADFKAMFGFDLAKEWEEARDDPYGENV